MKQKLGKWKNKKVNDIKNIKYKNNEITNNDKIGKNETSNSNVKIGQKEEINCDNDEIEKSKF